MLSSRKNKKGIRHILWMREYFRLRGINRKLGKDCPVFSNRGNLESIQDDDAENDDACKYDIFNSHLHLCVSHFVQRTDYSTGSSIMKRMMFALITQARNKVIRWDMCQTNPEVGPF